ncbi:DNA/RNA non-specific endonuclease [Streptomyces sp. NPDC051000]|uniref:DNA/RNA non-specific endonuclease n=1 Tax=Streptomyces sp. NPDC051000 TaxID=3155520 RepID=UPI0033D522F8
MHTTAAGVEVDAPDTGLSFVDDVDVAAMPSRGRITHYRIDEARAMHRRGRSGEAVVTLRAAAQRAPHYVHAHPMARELVGDMVRRGVPSQAAALSGLVRGQNDSQGFTPDGAPQAQNAPGADPGTGGRQDDSRDCRVGGEGWTRYGISDSANGSRATKAEACLDSKEVKDGTATKEGIKPPGYKWAGLTARWLGLEPRYSINACHLIGKDLGGSGTDLANLATCSRQANANVAGPGHMADHMYSIEEQVRDAVDAGQIVRYTVEPHYSANRTVPTGFTIGASGWYEDGRPGLSIKGKAGIVANSIYSPRFQHWEPGNLERAWNVQPHTHRSHPVTMDRNESRSEHPALASLRRHMSSERGQNEQVDWPAMEAAWGTAFPADFVAFMAEYGSGGISDSFQVALPNTPLLDGTSGMGQETANALGNWPAFGLTSEANDLKPPVIAWGVTVVGDIACWRTSAANPDDWTVIVFKNRSRRPWTEYGCGMTEFLRRTFLGEWDENPFNDETLWNATPQEFVHWREEADLFDIDNPWAGLEARSRINGSASRAGFTGTGRAVSCSATWIRPGLEPQSVTS